LVSMLMEMKTKLVLLLTVLTLSLHGADVAVWFYGPNTNGIATNFPTRFDANTNEPTRHAIMSRELAWALKNSTQPTWDAYQSNLNYQAQLPIKALKTQWESATKRLDEWTTFLGTPSQNNSNLVNIAQASQALRELIWLQQGLLRVIAPMFQPENMQ
jgi:hypothetical protein